MAGRQLTCKERVDAELGNTLSTLRDLWKHYQEHDDDYHPEHQTNMYEYGLDFTFVEPGTFDDQPEGYWRYQLSWGGPSDEFRFYDRGHDGTHIEYWFMDWFDGAKKVLRGTDRTLMLAIFDWLRGE